MAGRPWKEWLLFVWTLWATFERGLKKKKYKPTQHFMSGGKKETRKKLYPKTLSDVSTVNGWFQNPSAQIPERFPHALFCSFRLLTSFKRNTRLNRIAPVVVDKLLFFMRCFGSHCLLLGDAPVHPFHRLSSYSMFKLKRWIQTDIGDTEVVKWWIKPCDRTISCRDKRSSASYLMCVFLHLSVWNFWRLIFKTLGFCHPTSSSSNLSCNQRLFLMFNKILQFFSFSNLFASCCFVFFNFTLFTVTDPWGHWMEEVSSFSSYFSLPHSPFTPYIP